MEILLVFIVIYFTVGFVNGLISVLSHVIYKGFKKGLFLEFLSIAFFSVVMWPFLLFLYIGDGEQDVGYDEYLKEEYLKEEYR